MPYRELWKWGAEQDSQSSILAVHNHQFFFHLFFFTCTMDFAAKEGLLVDQLHGDCQVMNPSFSAQNPAQLTVTPQNLSLTITRPTAV